MALEIINGNVQFRFDLGAGPANVTNSAPVSDNKWHEVIVERYAEQAVHIQYYPLFSTYLIIDLNSKRHTFESTFTEQVGLPL